MGTGQQLVVKKSERVQFIKKGFILLDFFKEMAVFNTHVSRIKLSPLVCNNLPMKLSKHSHLLQSHFLDNKLFGYILRKILKAVSKCLILNCSDSCTEKDQIIQNTCIPLTVTWFLIVRNILNGC